MELCNNKEKLSAERKKSKKLRGKIVGVGNTMDSYGDKFLSDKKKSNFDSKKDKKTEEKFDSIGSYDPYKNDKTLQEKIGNIIEGVNALEEKEKKLDKKEEKEEEKKKEKE